jgi:hypothetical protein
VEGCASEIGETMEPGGRTYRCIRPLGAGAELAGALS